MLYFNVNVIKFSYKLPRFDINRNRLTVSVVLTIFEN